MLTLEVKSANSRKSFLLVLADAARRNRIFGRGEIRRAETMLLFCKIFARGSFKRYKGTPSGRLQQFSVLKAGGLTYCMCVHVCKIEERERQTDRRTDTWSDRETGPVTGQDADV